MLADRHEGCPFEKPRLRVHWCGAHPCRQFVDFDKRFAAHTGECGMEHSLLLPFSKGGASHVLTPPSARRPSLAELALAQHVQQHFQRSSDQVTAAGKLTQQRVEPRKVSTFSS